METEDFHCHLLVMQPLTLQCWQRPDTPTPNSSVRSGPSTLCQCQIRWSGEAGLLLLTDRNETTLTPCPPSEKKKTKIESLIAKQKRPTFNQPSLIILRTKKTSTE